VLFELAHTGSANVADLRRELNLDGGYLSRILAGLTANGLGVREQSVEDGRRQIVQLTSNGVSSFAELNRLQAKAIEDMQSPLGEDKRAELVDSMARIRHALGNEPRDVGLVLRPPAAGDLGWVVGRHGYRYSAEYDWDLSFEVLVARIVADYAECRDGRREAAWIAEMGGERVGCVFCTASRDSDTAQLRLLLVDPSARGAGVGSRLVDECLRFARRAGYRRITLWTNDCLLAARGIYERAGFECDRREAHHSFGHDLVGEYWWRDL
jgi:DNA-binding MarR family transcriptional regulator/GNAT superfamily N-acetyltransferase